MNQDSSPITPPPELVQAFLRSNPFTPAEMTYEQFIATRFARWGADQELEACCEWLHWQNLATHADLIPSLRAARRPKPPSPKEEALQVLKALIESRRIVDPEYQALRHALEQLDD
jgi:hypothetical protein